MKKNIFNLRLFIEGLKRLRVISLATAILSIAASALIPICTMIENQRDMYDGKFPEFDVFYAIGCIPAACVILLAPFFFKTLFSFLQKRKDSDFFHSIPYTRTCVYISFISAALVSIWAIQLASSLVSGILWSVVPGAQLDMGAYIATQLTYLLASAMLSAFMMLALTVSGTSGSCMILFVLFAGITRLICLIFGVALDDINFLDGNYLVESSFLSPFRFYPLSILWSMFNERDAAFYLFRPTVIVYSLIATAVLFAFAGFLYNRRHSEMAGNPAPGTRTQTFFRVLITLPLALLLTTGFLVTDYLEVSAGLVLAVATLLVYFLYELITTKRAKNMLKAAPGLGLVLAACVAFAIGFGATKAFILYENIDADEIDSVQISGNFLSGGTYQSAKSDLSYLDNEKIIEIVADCYEDTQRSNFDHDYIYTSTEKTVIRLKSGRKLHRYVRYTDGAIDSIKTILQNEENLMDVYYELPPEAYINQIWLYSNKEFRFSGSVLFNRKIHEIYEVFADEFASLTKEQKDRVIAPHDNRPGYNKYQEQENDLILCFSGEMQSTNDYYSYRSFTNDYLLTEDLPKTVNAIFAIFEDMTASTVAYYNYNAQAALIAASEQIHLLDDGERLNWSITIRPAIPNELLPKPIDTTVRTSPGALDEVLKLLEQNRNTDNDGVTPRYLISIHYNDSSMDVDSFELYIPYAIPADDLARILEIIEAS